jgi:hypothetical protein
MANHNNRLYFRTFLTEEVHDGRDRPLVERRRFARVLANESARIRMISPVVSDSREARVLDTSREGLRLRVPKSLLCGATIEIRLTDSIAFGEVRYCRRVGSAFEVGVQIQDSFPAQHRSTPLPRRKEPRNPTDAAGILRLEDHPEGVFMVTILDVSKSGLRVRCPTGREPGTRVEINCGTARIAGTVRYTREVEPNEFNMGINADRVSRDDFLGAAEEIDLTLLFGL